MDAELDDDSLSLSMDEDRANISLGEGHVDEIAAMRASLKSSTARTDWKADMEMQEEEEKAEFERRLAPGVHGLIGTQASWLPRGTNTPES